MFYSQRICIGYNIELAELVCDTDRNRTFGGNLANTSVPEKAEMQKFVSSKYNFATFF